MSEWLVRLQGSDADLQEMSDEFRSPELKVSKEEDGYFLRSTEDLGGLTDHHDVLEQATELLQLLTGIIKLRSGYSEAVRPDGYVIRINDDGTRNRFMDLQATVRVRAKLTLGAPSTIVSGPPEAEAWMILARQDEKVFDALRFFQEETTWWSLRRAYEVVESELKQPSRIAKLKWASEKQIKHFKEWAGHYVHGERRDLPDQRYYPRFTLPEAESFIQRLLIEWLRWKLNKLD